MYPDRWSEGLFVYHQATFLLFDRRPDWRMQEDTPREREQHLVLNKQTEVLSSVSLPLEFDTTNKFFHLVLIQLVSVVEIKTRRLPMATGPLE